MKIEIVFSKLTNGMLAGLVGHTLQTINISNEPELTGHEKVVALTASYENYKTALSKRTYNLYTREMTNGFKALSKSFAAFKRHANFLTYSTDDNEVQLGEQVKKHLSSLGRSWNRMRKADQSAYIHNILTEFGKAEYADLMVQTTLNRKLEVMQTAVEAYDAVVTSCINDRVDIKALGSASALRTQLTADYTKVYSYVQGLIDRLVSGRAEKSGRVVLDCLASASRSIVFMSSTVRPTTSPPSAASRAALAAIPSVTLALSVF